MVEQYQDRSVEIDDFRPRTLRTLIDASENTEALLNIQLANPSGKVITATDPEYYDQNWWNQTAFQEGLLREHVGKPVPKMVATELSFNTSTYNQWKLCLFGSLQAVDVATQLEKIGADKSCENAAEWIPHLKQLANQILEELKVRVS